MLKRWIIRWLGLDARYVRHSDSYTEAEKAENLERFKQAIERQWELAENLYSGPSLSQRCKNPYLDALQRGDYERKPLAQIMKEIEESLEAEFKGAGLGGVR